jgi:hypothetical protein
MQSHQDPARPIRMARAAEKRCVLGRFETPILEHLRIADVQRLVCPGARRTRSLILRLALTVKIGSDDGKQSDRN